jgi:alpha-tubulin suppressor-like RCC1 family protein
MWSATHSPFRLAPVVAGALLIALAGCGEDTPSPTAPGSTPAPALEAATAALVSFTTVSAGGAHTCALASDGRVYCWGFNGNGQLGDGTRTNRSSPVAVTGTLRFVQVSAGAIHTCAVTADNRAYCWGWNENGQLGVGDSQDRWTPTAVAGGRRFVRIRAGTYHTCAVNPYDVGFCWGSSRFGALGGLGTSPNYGITPTRVAGGLSFRSVIAGGGFTCGTTTNNKGYCWGYNYDGALGDGTRIHRFKPVAITGGLSFRSVIAGGGGISDAQGKEIDETHTCGLTTDNLAYCWGAYSRGQLGNGSSGSQLKPSKVLGGLHFGQVIAGYYYSCGVTTTKVAYCWGAGSFGQIGDGTTSFSNRDVPTKVAGALLFGGVTAGPVGSHTCGITTGNKIYCWGYNGSGQLGDGTTATRWSPVKVAGQS